MDELCKLVLSLRAQFSISAGFSRARRSCVPPTICGSRRIFATYCTWWFARWRLLTQDFAYPPAKGSPTNCVIHRHRFMWNQAKRVLRKCNRISPKNFPLFIKAVRSDLTMTVHPFSLEFCESGLIFNPYLPQPQKLHASSKLCCVNRLFQIQNPFR